MLITKTELKRFIGIEADDTDQDDLLDDLISAVSEQAKLDTGRQLESSVITEYHVGDGTNRLMLNEWPVNSIASIHDDDDRVWDANDAIDTDDIQISNQVPGLIIYDGGYFTIGTTENIKVVYNAGYATIPADLKQAVKELCAYKYRSAKLLQNTSEEEPTIPASLRKAYEGVIQKYKKYR